MEFGICFDTHIDKWDLIRYVEELGYDRAWVPDSQMIWSDCYATMALAARFPALVSRRLPRIRSRRSTRSRRGASFSASGRGIPRCA